MTLKAVIQAGDLAATSEQRTLVADPTGREGLRLLTITSGLSQPSMMERRASVVIGTSLPKDMPGYGCLSTVVAGRKLSETQPQLRDDAVAAIRPEGSVPAVTAATSMATSSSPVTLHFSTESSPLTSIAAMPCALDNSSAA